MAFRLLRPLRVRASTPMLLRKAGPEFEEPLCGEILGIERLEELARTLATTQRVTFAPSRGRSIARRVRENGRRLVAAYHEIARTIAAERASTPAAEWLVDNFHIVEDQLREIREDLPPAFYRQLPKLIDGPFRGYPRLLSLAWSFVEHTDSRVDLDALRAFIGAYQTGQALTIGELWAVPIALRIVLIENLRRIAMQILGRRAARQAADGLADALIALGPELASSSPPILTPHESAPLDGTFAVQLFQRLRDQDVWVVPAITWLHERLAAQGTTVEMAIRLDHHRQAAINVSVQNAITSMRLMSSVDWREFVESVSVVDAILREGSAFATMDFPSRDLYRHAIEALSRGSGVPESEVARRALEHARGSEEEPAADGAPSGARRDDPGYFLIAEGRSALERDLRYRPSLRDLLKKTVLRAAVPGYLAAIAAGTALFLFPPLAAETAAAEGVWRPLLLALVALVPASDLAIALINRTLAELIGPRLLPKLGFRDGIPRDGRTLVAIPTLLSGEDDIRELARRLEVHYLGNPDDGLRFALVTDWMDAPEESMPDDDGLLATAAAEIERLNGTHGLTPDGDERFLLLHRRRTFNPGEGCWMGWERKRGKLHELNRLLRGAGDTTFLRIGGRSPVVPEGVRAVITLDADTRLPRGTARRLVGALLHPLNRPEIDRASGRVVAGHAVLQPRVVPTLPNDTEGSLVQRLFAGPSGLDPYASLVSDVYQDLFEEGSYAGKGIYDVDAFEAALADRVPQNTLLSHDLFEGIFARAGLVTDVEFYEEFPARYEAYTARQHRWARGDWQLLPWVIGLPPRGARRGGITLTGRWKMVDNLRWTLSAPAALLTLLGAVTLSALPPVAWAAFVVATVTIPALLSVLARLVPRETGVSWNTHLRALARELASGLARAGLFLGLLAHQAWLMVDAIARTLARLLLTRRRRLEWVTAAEAATQANHALGGLARRMAVPVVLAAAAMALAITVRPSVWPVAASFGIVWLVSPAVAWWISRQTRARDARPLSPADARALRLIARRTWRFFETLVGPEDNALPPDNLHEDPESVVAHRTSPTNIGVYLLSIVAARDFGWIGLLDAVDRIEATLDTMKRLEHHRGHLFNWYDTRDLRPLEPRYVSSVDSGNLAGHLLVLSRALREMIDAPVFGSHVLSGLTDALDMVRAAAERIPPEGRTQTVTRREFDAELEEIDRVLARSPATDAEWAEVIASLGERTRALVDMARVLAQETGEAAGAQAADWAEVAAGQVASIRRDFDELLPEAGVRDMVTAPAAPSGSVSAGAAAESAARVSSPEAAATRGNVVCATLVRRVSGLAASARAQFLQMDFAFLLDPVKLLLSLGYRGADGALDSTCYDLLASEARLASFLAIAKGDVPWSHWFRLGRSWTLVDGRAALASWSGSMFEYLMPALVMASPPSSLLDETYRAAVRRHIRYGKERHVPWGVSESAFNIRDRHLTYQYSGFGVPGLGLKRGLVEDLVVAPYATALAAMVDPAAAAINFEHLAREGALGALGFHDAIDYTERRRRDRAAPEVVKAYMAHHQGMTIAALANVLLDGCLKRRFHADSLVQAAELLLQERTPRDVAVTYPRAEETVAEVARQELAPAAIRRYRSVHETPPRTHLLSNGGYAVMITAAGSGYSRFGDLAVTRWREDVTRDDYGAFFFLRDVRSGEVWSAGFQPSGVEADSYEAVFREDRAEIRRRDGALATRMEVVVSPEDDAEVRRLTLTNFGLKTREIEITSYAEIVLAPPAADAAHPAFQKLFVQTEALMGEGVLLATRRPRSPEEPAAAAANVVAVTGDTVGAPQFETDRARFVGRCRGIRTPMCVIDGRPLSNTAGPVLDPIFCQRRRIRLAGGATRHLVFSTLIGPSREAVLRLIDKYRDPNVFDRVAALAWTEAQIDLYHLGIGAYEANLFQRLASRILYAERTLRAPSDVLERLTRGQSALWPHGVSGDLPIVLVKIDETEDRALVRQILKAHEYWRGKNVAVDVVILNERPISYQQDLQRLLEALVRTGTARARGGSRPTRGSVHVLRSDQVPADDRTVLEAAARVILLSRRGTLEEQLERPRPPERPVPRPRARPIRPLRSPEAEIPPPRLDLEYFNGLGGFAEKGREYVTVLGKGQWTPAPWVNVIANPKFGFLVSESGLGYTWAGNSRENQITAWSNDPVSDPAGEAIYVRDEITGDLWTPTLLPIREEAFPYVVRHGQGYSRFEHMSHGVRLDLLVFAPLDDPIKISRLRISNRSPRRRRLSVTGYLEWVLGPSRSASAPFIVTEIDPATGALLARSAWSAEFGDRIAFADLGGRQSEWTADRTEFLGRNGTLDHPAALERGAHLSGRVGARLDPCAALLAIVEIPAGGEAEVLFLLGQAGSREEARALIRKYRGANLDASLAAVARAWDDVLGTLEVRTPDRAMDILLNRWLLYQGLACRLWGRCALYQASGAYGFRDQIQDVMALVLSRRDIVRAHLVLCASRQFPEGDVQHWWHPPSGRGVRTRISDDRVWMPYAVVHYVEVTGDRSILDEVVPFIEGPLLGEDELELYFEPSVSAERASVYEHCARALDRSLDVGPHGLPLMGTGDWNDGMNRVGYQGKGESVWLGWLLHTTLWEFARIAEERGDDLRATRWRQHVKALKSALEREAWDGDWYRRAFFDDGTALGSAANAECRIDSIAQTWSVLTGGADATRAASAMDAVEEYLVRRGDGLVLLFTPPFDKTTLDPGYVKSYLPGIRENGGQYTHAAMWTVVAFAALGRGDEAGELFTILNPIHHASTRAGVHRYKVEPYVVAADVYSEPPHTGRGGWTWYTGSAGWMYRAGVEWILGFRLKGTTLLLDPCIPRAWRRYELSFRYHSARYEIVVENPRGISKGIAMIELDGAPLAEPRAGVPLQDDGAMHKVRVVLG